MSVVRLKPTAKKTKRQEKDERRKEQRDLASRHMPDENGFVPRNLRGAVIGPNGKPVAAAPQASTRRK
ncbi:hypothetical protein [Arthrobacter sp. H5]|uniref:hypothetical protein n=1 Tax=Arthrobacter sp. H5 TaxID=1267973 RepID=UPI0004B1B62E|nr:hypothetical protein [Arthrobacter sp. H5]